MSLQNRLDSLIGDFCQTLSKNYNIPTEELMRIWNGESIVPFSTSSSTSSSSATSSSSTTSSSTSSDFVINESTVLGANKDMLSAMCKKCKLKSTGRKEELSTLLLNFLRNGGTPSTASASTSSSASAKTKGSKSTVPEPAVLKALKATAEEIKIAKNRYGNWEHASTGFVFVNRIVVGKQMDNGEISTLSVDDIERCKRDKIPFKQPEKLVSDKDSSMVDSLKVEDEDEEEEDIVEEEVDMEDELAEDDEEDDK